MNVTVYRKRYLKVLFIKTYTHESFVKNNNYSLRAGARMVLVRIKFVRHGGTRDLFCYMEEHVTCKKYMYIG